jgi:DNA repair protein RecO (recombination protein O)
MILARMDFGEADRIFTILTRNRGKMRVIAKGVRRPGSRLGRNLEFFNLCELMLATGRELDVVAGAETLERFDQPRENLDIYAHASYLTEMLLQMTEDGDESPQTFDLLLRSLRLLCEGIEPFLVTRNFELSLCRILGFNPELYRCISCSEPIQAVPNALSPHLGGMLCPKCLSADHGSVRLSVNAQKFIRTLDRGGLAEAIKLRLDTTTANEVERALHQYARNHARRDLSSLKVLRSIHEGLPAGSYDEVYKSTK